MTKLDTSGLRSYAERDWGAPARLALRQRVQQSVTKKVQVAIELYEAARNTRPDWPDEQTRRADFESHRRVKAMLAKAPHVGAR